MQVKKLWPYNNNYKILVTIESLDDIVYTIFYSVLSRVMLGCDFSFILFQLTAIPIRKH